VIKWCCLLMVLPQLGRSDSPRLARTIERQRELRSEKHLVGNLDFSATESYLRALFEPYGRVDRVNPVTDRDTGRSRGFAFVEMTGSRARAQFFTRNRTNSGRAAADIQAAPGLAANAEARRNGSQVPGISAATKCTGIPVRCSREGRAVQSHSCQTWKEPLPGPMSLPQRT
jgi:cold-inducible RNA-binding protein